jgi:hypothetical protein
MNEKIAGRAGSYKVSKTGQSVRVVVRMSRKTFDAIEVVNTERGYGTDSWRNTLLTVTLMEAFERKREVKAQTPAQNHDAGGPCWTPEMILKLQESNASLTRAAAYLAEAAEIQAASAAPGASPYRPQLRLLSR